MGRYITGDIEGKCWFGVQPSDFPDRFGAMGQPLCDEDETVAWEYFFEKGNLPRINEELGNLMSTMGDYHQKLKNFFDAHMMYNEDILAEALNVSKPEAHQLVRLYADYEFGEQLKEYLENNEMCCFVIDN